MILFGTDILQMILKASLSFVILLTLARLLGKKQMSHLTFFNYITGITIGSVAANIISNKDPQYLGDFIGLSWWCLLTWLTGFINLKSGTIRTIIDDQPSILIKKGKIQKDQLNKLRINVDDLLMLLREQNAFSLRDVDYAIFEPNGLLSVLKMRNQQSVAKQDLNIATQPNKNIPSEIITDGKVIYQNLKEFNISKEWVDNQLRIQGVQSIKDVILAEYQMDGTLYIDRV